MMKCSRCEITPFEIDPDTDPADLFAQDVEGEWYCMACAEDYGEWECSNCGGGGEVQAMVQSPVALEPRMERCKRCSGRGIIEGTEG